MNWIVFTVGCILSAMFGGCSGLVIVSLIVAAKNADEQMEKARNTYESN